MALCSGFSSLFSNIFDHYRYEKETQSFGRILDQSLHVFFLRTFFSAQFPSLFSKSFMIVTSFDTIIQWFHYLFLIIGTILLDLS